MYQFWGIGFRARERIGARGGVALVLVSVTARGSVGRQGCSEAPLQRMVLRLLAQT
jgi:hypothetical protein